MPPHGWPQRLRRAVGIARGHDVVRAARRRIACRGLAQWLTGSADRRWCTATGISASSAGGQRQSRGC